MQLAHHKVHMVSTYHRGLLSSHLTCLPLHVWQPFLLRLANFLFRSLGGAIRYVSTHAAYLSIHVASGSIVVTRTIPQRAAFLIIVHIGDIREH